MAATTTRKRRGRSTTKYSDSTNANGTTSEDDDDVFLDEDDQIELIESLEQEAASQTRFFHGLFGFGIGGMAVVFSLILPVLCPDECSAGNGRAMACWSHSVYSCCLHAWSVHPFVLSKQQSLTTNGPPSIMIDALLQAIPILVWFTGLVDSNDGDEDYFHVALLIGNLVTFGGARLMYWDMQSTQRSLEGLNAARYKHKAL